MHRLPSFLLLASLAACTTSANDADSATVTAADTATRPGASTPTSPTDTLGATRATGAMPAECAPGAITGDGVGPVRIDMAANDLRARCAIARDTTEPADEGSTVRVVYVPLGRDTVRAEVDVGKVWRIGVTSPGLRTADSLGVGTPVSRLAAFEGARGISGEGRLFVTIPSHCGLSFQLPADAARQLPAGGDRAALRRLPQSARVTRVLIVGCRSR